jgi:RNA polymerase sigma-70 factor (ECF subfamily)
VLLVEAGKTTDVAESPTAASAGPGSAAQSAVAALLAHQATVFLICLGFVRRRGDAEELAQETYLRALRRVPDLRDEALLKPWLCRIARNTCLDHLRRARLRRFVGLSEAPEPHTRATPETLLHDEERYRALRQAVATMPRKLHDVLVLREYGGLGYQEIAAALGIEPGTVMSRLHRARARLVRQLRGEAL